LCVQTHTPTRVHPNLSPTCLIMDTPCVASLPLTLCHPCTCSFRDIKMWVAGGRVLGRASSAEGGGGEGGDDNADGDGRQKFLKSDLCVVALLEVCSDADVCEILSAATAVTRSGRICRSRTLSLACAARVRARPGLLCVVVCPSPPLPCPPPAPCSRDPPPPQCQARMCIHACTYCIAAYAPPPPPHTHARTHILSLVHSHSLPRSHLRLRSLCRACAHLSDSLPRSLSRSAKRGHIGARKQDSARDGLSPPLGG